MARPKGSKNKKRSAQAVMTLEQIAAAKETANEEISALNDAVMDAAQALKAKKAELKAAQKKLAALVSQEAACQQAAAEEARRADAEKLMAAFMESEKSLDEVLDTLK